MISAQTLFAFVAAKSRFRLFSDYAPGRMRRRQPYAALAGGSASTEKIAGPSREARSFLATS
jgi:hypothetical protein